VDENTVK